MSQRTRKKGPKDLANCSKQVLQLPKPQSSSWFFIDFYKNCSQLTESLTKPNTLFTHLHLSVLRRYTDFICCYTGSVQKSFTWEPNQIKHVWRETLPVTSLLKDSSRPPMDCFTSCPLGIIINTFPRVYSDHSTATFSCVYIVTACSTHCYWS